MLLILAAHQNHLGSSEEIPLPELYSVPRHKGSLIVVPRLGYGKLFKIFWCKKHIYQQKLKPKAQGTRAEHTPMISEKHLGGLVCPASLHWHTYSSPAFLICLGSTNHVFLHLQRWLTCQTKSSCRSLSMQWDVSSISRIGPSCLLEAWAVFQGRGVITDIISITNSVSAHFPKYIAQPWSLDIMVSHTSLQGEERQRQSF